VYNRVLRCISRTTLLDLLEMQLVYNDNKIILIIMCPKLFGKSPHCHLVPLVAANEFTRADIVPYLLNGSVDPCESFVGINQY